MSKNPDDTPARSLGGRFREATDPLLDRINRSVDLDQRLWAEDLEGSRGHAAMLLKVGLLTAEEHQALADGLDAVVDEFRTGHFVFRKADEDVHMAVERRLGELIGEPAKKLHTGRSRNDQVITDTLLWLRRYLDRLGGEIVDLARLLLSRAEASITIPMPALTHYQPAQVSSVAQWLLSHAAGLERSLRRLAALQDRLDECPLGSGAAAGSYLPLDRDATAQALGFRCPTINAIQATGTRSDVLDALAALAVLGADLSRLGEELVLFSSSFWGWLRLPDRLTTGSSLLPQKSNPDGAELLRGGGKLLAADFTALASVTSGLASGYSKDLQLDKEVLFRAADRALDLVELAALHIDGLEWHEANLRRACGPELAALFLADRLVAAGVPFRQAHHAVGKAVRLAEEQASDLAGVLGEALADLEPGLPRKRRTAVQDELARSTPDTLLAGLQTAGSAGPTAAKAQLAELEQRLERFAERLSPDPDEEL